MAAYQKHLEDRGLAPQTIRHYMKPVRRAAKWVASNWPWAYPNICENLRHPMKTCRGVKYDGQAGNPVLLLGEVLEFIDWLERHPVWNRLAPGVVLQGLAGLSVLEALRLTWGKVDFKTGTVTIDGDVKNSSRVRCIPIAEAVLWILRKAQLARLSIRENDLIIPLYRDYRHYSNAIRKALRAWNPEVSIKAKDLRNTIQTAAIDGGWYGYYVQRYVGHAPSSIGEKHYHGDQGDRLLPLYRQKVLSHIQAAVEEWGKDRDSSVLPGPRLLQHGKA